MEFAIVTFVVGSAVVLIATAVTLVLRDTVVRVHERQVRRVSGRNRDPQLKQLPPNVDERPQWTISGRLYQMFEHLIAESGMRMGTRGAWLVMLLSGTLLGGVFLHLENLTRFVGIDDIQGGLIPGLIAFFVGLLLPLFFFQVRRSLYRRKMEQLLPDSLYLLARAVRAGESVDHAIGLVGRETPEPLGIEFRRAARQMEMGLSLNGAMRAMARRNRLTEVRLFCTTLMVHRQSGGNVATTLERLADVMRSRVSFRRNFRSAVAGGKMATITVAAAAMVIFLYIAFWNRQYLDRFLDNPLGWSLLATAGMLQLVGVLWVVLLMQTDH